MNRRRREGRGWLASQVRYEETSDHQPSIPSLALSFHYYPLHPTVPEHLKVGWEGSSSDGKTRRGKDNPIQTNLPLPVLSTLRYLMVR